MQINFSQEIKSINEYYGQSKLFLALFKKSLDK